MYEYTIYRTRSTAVVQSIALVYSRMVLYNCTVFYRQIHVRRRPPTPLAAQQVRWRWSPRRCRRLVETQNALQPGASSCHPLFPVLSPIFLRTLVCARHTACFSRACFSPVFRVPAIFWCVFSGFHGRAGGQCPAAAAAAAPSSRIWGSNLAILGRLRRTTVSY